MSQRNIAVDLSGVEFNCTGFLWFSIEIIRGPSGPADLSLPNERTSGFAEVPSLAPRAPGGRRCPKSLEANVASALRKLNLYQPKLRNT